MAVLRHPDDAVSRGMYQAVIEQRNEAAAKAKRLGAEVEGLRVAGDKATRACQDEAKRLHAEVERLREALGAMTKSRDNWHRKYGEMREVAKRNASFAG